mmetsp:Transcript_66683/g.124547  ORF Transcript_66683/g.124547 Transcript_66683/m.124547 type:complete len:178 (+) Transcript_66683:113-646(+)
MAKIDAEMLKRGAVLAVFNITFLFVILLQLSVLSFLSTVGGLVILAGGAFNFSTGEKVPSKEAGTLSKERLEQIDKVLEMIKEFAKKVVVEVEDVVLWKDTAQTTKALVVLVVLRTASAWIGLQTLLYLGGNLLLLAMWGPKELVMKHLGPHIDKACKVRDDLLAKVPRYDDLAKNK